jgi:ribonuclease HII
MVIAAVAVPSDDVCARLDVKDSKVLSAKERGRLYALIRKQCRVSLVRIGAGEIDALRSAMTMNAVVARAHATAISRLAPDIAYLDACDVNPLRYAEMVRGGLRRPCELVSEHHADEKFPVVSAASIVAKVTRDRAIARLAKEYGDIGSGYPSDPETIRFLTGYIEEHGAPPPIARRSWKTVGAIIAKRSQSSLADYL